MLYKGPGLLKEYLGDFKKTKEVLIDVLSWRQNLDVSILSSKLYKSDDLVHFLPDDTMMYIGQKDMMVKVREQKLEVKEVESVIRKSLDGSNQVAVDLVELHNSGFRLIAFLKFSDNRDLNENTNDRDSSMLQSNSVSDGKISILIVQIRFRFNKTLSGYIVSRIFMSLVTFSVNSNGKLDHKKLKEYIRNLSTSELFKYIESGSSEKVLTEISQDDTVVFEISGIFDNILRGPVSKEENPLKEKNAILENLDLDFLRTVSFARSVNNFYDLNIPVKTFRKINLNIRDLVEIVHSWNQIVSQSEDHVRIANILQDIEKLDKDLTEMQFFQYILSKMKLSTDKSMIFLIEATGFFGSQIL